MNKSIYEYYSINASDPIQKFSIYLLVDDYFQGEADWFFQFSSAGNILRSNDTSILSELGFSQTDIIRYKNAAAAYLREPGMDTFRLFDLVPNNFDEARLKIMADKVPVLSGFLKDFKRVSVEKCVEALERYL